MPVGPISRMFDFDSSTSVLRMPVHVDPLAVVVDRYRQLLLGGVLPDHVLIQKFLYFQRLGNLVGRARGGFDLIVFQDRIADRDALVANVGTRIIAGRGDQLADYILALVAKRTAQSIIGSGTLQAVFSWCAFRAAFSGSA